MVLFFKHTQRFVPVLLEYFVVLLNLEELLTGNGDFSLVSVRTKRREKCVYNLILRCDHVVIVVWKRNKF